MRAIRPPDLENLKSAFIFGDSQLATMHLSSGRINFTKTYHWESNGVISPKISVRKCRWAARTSQLRMPESFPFPRVSSLAALRINFNGAEPLFINETTYFLSIFALQERI
jgi:hypothetical protein